MAPIVPVLALSSAAEALVISLLFPQHLPPNPLVYVLVRALGVNILLLLIWKVNVYPFLFSPLRHLPSPSGAFPIIGHGMVLFKKPPAKDLLRWVSEVPNDGIIHFRGFFNTDRLLLTNTKALAEVLVQQSYAFQKPGKVRSFLRRVLGDGLIIVEGDVHKFQRKHIMPVFSFRHIKELYPMMWKKSIALTEGVLEQIRESANSSGSEKNPSAVVEVNHWANKVTMDIIGVAGLGREFNALKNSDDPLIQNYEEILEPTSEKVLYFALQVVGPQKFINALPWKVNERMHYTTNQLRIICRDLVREKRRLIKASADDNFDILSVLIKANNFSDDELVDQLLTFLAAGHETTSSAFTWTTYLLATHPEIQNRLREEVNAAFPNGVTSESDLAGILEALPLLNGVCNEAIRLYPTVPITIRDSVQDTVIVGHHIPKGSQILISPWAINRNPHLWADADDFKPERWVNPETGKPNKTGGAESNYCILTFLHGPRSCIGKDFAMAELRCLVASFVQAFDLELADKNEEMIPAGVITTKPRNGMHLLLRPIDRV